MNYIDVLTVIIVIVFALLILTFYLKDFKRNMTRYTSFLVFKEYNRRLAKVAKLIKEESITKILESCELSIVDPENPNDKMIYDNIKIIDAVEDNLELLKSIKKEFKHQGAIQNKISLLKDNLNLNNLSEFVAEPKHRKHKAIMEFERNLNEIVIDEKYRKVMSDTPCYKFGNVFMFLPDNILRIDMENIFSAEIVDYLDIGINVWISEEGYLDFDGTYDLEKTKHKFPENADKEDLTIKELVYAKKYVLSFVYKEITFDVVQTEVLTERQEIMDKLASEFPKK